MIAQIFVFFCSCSALAYAVIEAFIFCSILKVRASWKTQHESALTMLEEINIQFDTEWFFVTFRFWSETYFIRTFAYMYLKLAKSFLHFCFLFNFNLLSKNIHCRRCAEHTIGKPLIELALVWRTFVLQRTTHFVIISLLSYLFYCKWAH